MWPRGRERPPARRKLRRLLPYFGPYRTRALATVALMLIVTASGLAIPALAQFAIDDGIIVAWTSGTTGGPVLRIERLAN